MTEVEKLEAATSILRKLTGSYVDFERWPSGDGWANVEGNTDLTATEVRFLSMIVVPKEQAGPGGLPADWGDGDE